MLLTAGAPLLALLLSVQRGCLNNHRWATMIMTRSATVSRIPSASNPRSRNILAACHCAALSRRLVFSTCVLLAGCLQIYGCDGTANQRWLKDADGALRPLHALESCMDVAGDLKPGTKLQVSSRAQAASSSFGLHVLKDAAGAVTCTSSSWLTSIKAPHQVMLPRDHRKHQVMCLTLLAVVTPGRQLAGHVDSVLKACVLEQTC